MLFYLHTPHWRKTLHAQHTRFAKHPGAGISSFPPLQAGKGNAAIVFSWLGCPDCQINSPHWFKLQDYLVDVKETCAESYENLDDPPPPPPPTPAAPPKSKKHKNKNNVRKGKGGMPLAAPQRPPRKVGESSSSAPRPVHVPTQKELLVNKFWEKNNWVLNYAHCPVVWHLQHKADPDTAWGITNPLESVAVDTLLRVYLKAAGWDVPPMPDGTCFRGTWRPF
jgi:hypothetical protein